MKKPQAARYIAIIEARMGSSRLPGKVMLDLAGAPLLQRMVERVRRSSRLADTVVATTTAPSDDIIAALCADIGCPVFRGSRDDMLDRLLKAAQAHSADVIVQLTGDCPLIDPTHIDRTIALREESDADYVCNNLRPTLPIGFDVRLFPTAVLKEVDKLTADPIDRIHGSYYIYTHPERFSLAGWEADTDMWPELRLTVDEYLDYKLVKLLFEALHRDNPAFSAADAVAWLRAHPELAQLNASVRQKRPEEG